MLPRAIRTPEEEKLYQHFVPLLEKMGYALVELHLRYRRGGAALEIVIHGAHLSVDDCARVLRLLKPKAQLLLDLADLHMEVMSPGIDRVLKNRDELALFVGKGLKLLDTRSQRWEGGILEAVTEDHVVLRKGAERRSIPIDSIGKAKLDFTQEETTPYGH
ncbi:Ribosome maturation factor rimP [Spirochaeta thermophila DSM 6578]|uniref:Ribosome maturation factor RimP n=1 Tax=Winmispira thermophila (strain ATCC 700085 / DSM 6578 / Z-1203) TaxID=869211 RepID=G0GE68_WINT7|nr:ribosome maturation factor RimP [Spirochaeta thermophila]AEJ61421.1 Ribosome maturation factor rimP [Spirochaeta thermophila DSM 6578]